MSLRELNNDAVQLVADFKALRERVDYLHVAVMRGDPRFAKVEYAKPGFDCGGFDAWWRGKGKRVPGMEEVFG